MDSPSKRAVQDLVEDARRLCKGKRSKGRWKDGEINDTLTVPNPTCYRTKKVFVSPRHDPVGAHAKAVSIEIVHASAQMVLGADHRHQASHRCGFTVGALDIVLSQHSNQRQKPTSVDIWPLSEVLLKNFPEANETLQTSLCRSGEVGKRSAGRELAHRAKASR